jgi:hypothetical protein
VISRTRLQLREGSMGNVALWRGESTLGIEALRAVS